MNIVKTVFLSTATAVGVQTIVIIVSLYRFSKSKEYRLKRVEQFVLILLLLLPPIVYLIYSLLVDTTSTNSIKNWVRLIANSIAVPWGLALPVPLVSMIALVLHHLTIKKKK